MSGCVRLDYAPPHHTTHHAHQGSSFWSILDAFCCSFLFSRESRIYGGEGRRLRILDSQRLRYLGVPWRLLVFLSSRESGIYGGEGKRFRILDSQGLCLREHFGCFFILPARIGDSWIGTRAYTYAGTRECSQCGGAQSHETRFRGCFRA